jgi:hypothetical protein
MDIYKELKRQAIDPVLKKHLFKKRGILFARELDSGIMYIVTLGVKSTTINNFFISISYGIYFNGLFELLYGFPFEIKRGVASSMYRSYLRNKDEFNCAWSVGVSISFEEFKNEVIDSLENNIIPFFNKITIGEELLRLFQDEINNYIKKDIFLALQIGCLNFLLGEKDKGKEIVRMVIRASKESYEFAENVLERMEK